MARPPNHNILASRVNGTPVPDEPAGAGAWGPVARALFEELETELVSTAHAVRGLPEDRADFSPGEGARTLHALVRHIASVLDWWTLMLTEGYVDVNEAPSPLPAESTLSEMAEAIEQRASAVFHAAQGLGERDLDRVWKIFDAGTLIGSIPRRRVSTSYGLHHLIHHRGQLILYRRLLGLHVPEVYGAI